MNIKKINKILGLCIKRSRELSFGLAILILLGTLLFMYNNGFHVLRKAKIVEALKKQVAINVTDIIKWEKIQKDIEWKKHKVQDGALTRNPFE
ncbi:MAG: hypothetical protein ABIJ91_04625 [Candidatus Kuenenbacteria bacterium]